MCLRPYTEVALIFLERDSPELDICHLHPIVRDETIKYLIAMAEHAATMPHAQPIPDSVLQQLTDLSYKSKTEFYYLMSTRADAYNRLLIELKKLPAPAAYAARLRRIYAEYTKGR